MIARPPIFGPPEAGHPKRAPLRFDVQRSGTVEFEIIDSDGRPMTTPRAYRACTAGADALNAAALAGSRSLARALEVLR